MAVMLRRLTMAELRALAAVKANKTLSRAADALHVTQPTLSQHIRGIEQKLGLHLFDRHRRGMEPTRTGLVMLRLATTLQIDMSLAAEELAIAARTGVRPIRIGSMPITSAGILAVALGQFATTASSNESIVIMEGPREQMLEHLRHDRIDLFVGRLPAEGEIADFRRELLFLDTVVVVCASKHPLAQRRSAVAVKDLVSFPWVMPAEDTSFYQQVAETFRGAGTSSPRGLVQSYSMHAIPAIVASSSLLGFLPASLFAAGTMGQVLRRVPVSLTWTPDPIGVLTRLGARDDEKLQRVMRALRAVAGGAHVPEKSRP